eukprot:scaffold34137_cov37-Phaeocystis_antarctica.AAC.1
MPPSPRPLPADETLWVDEARAPTWADVAAGELPDGDLPTAGGEECGEDGEDGERGERPAPSWLSSERWVMAARRAAPSWLSRDRRPPSAAAPPAAPPPAAPPAAPPGWPKPRLTAIAALDAARAMPERKLELRRPKDPDLTSPVPEADELRGWPAGDSAELRCESGVDELRSEPWARSRSMFDELTSESRGLSGSGVAAAAADAADADADAAAAVAVVSRSTLSCAASSTSDTPRVRPGAVTLSARL